MYFPLLRGRQYELIAIRELVELNLLSNNIIPIVEPVKANNTFVKTLDKYIGKNKKIAIVHNPKVGSFTEDMDNDKKIKEKIIDLSKDSNILMLHHLSEDTEEKIIKLFNAGYKKSDILTLCNNKDYIKYYLEYFSDEPPKYNLIPAEIGFSRKIKYNKVMLSDKFTRKQKNVEYADLIDEPFSEDHLYYHEEGYIGFSDYSVIGNEYSNSGFAPFAVVIHIVYFDNNSSLRIRHFVSDSNDDYSDPAGKFSEALKKLIIWNNEQQINTYSMQIFNDLYEEERYPGLGTVKKLSIMHHLELLGSYLDSQ